MVDGPCSYGTASALSLLVFFLETFLLETFDNDKWYYQNNDGDNVMDHIVRLCSFSSLHEVLTSYVTEGK